VTPSAPVQNENLIWHAQPDSQIPQILSFTSHEDHGTGTIVSVVISRAGSSPRDYQCCSVVYWR